MGKERASMDERRDARTGSTGRSTRVGRRRFLRLVALGGGTATLVALGVACQQAPAAPPKPAESKPAETKPAAPVAPAAKPTEAAKPAAETKPAQQAPATAAAAQVIVMQGVDANTLDPSFRNSTPEFNINAHVFNMHTWRDSKTLKVVPEF